MIQATFKIENEKRWYIKKLSELIRENYEMPEIPLAPMCNPDGSALDVDAGEGSMEEETGEEHVCIVFVGDDDDTDEDIVECVDLENETGEE